MSLTRSVLCSRDQEALADWRDQHLAGSLRASGGGYAAVGVRLRGSRLSVLRYRSRVGHWLAARMPDEARVTFHRAQPSTTRPWRWSGVVIGERQLAITVGPWRAIEHVESGVIGSCWSLPRELVAAAGLTELIDLRPGSRGCAALLQMTGTGAVEMDRLLHDAAALPANPASEIDRLVTERFVDRSVAVLRREARLLWHQRRETAAGRLAWMATERIRCNGCAADFRLASVATTYGIGQRSLQLAFQQHVGMSAQRYVLLHRLHRAREALLDSAADGSVSTAMRQAGFRHRGRFAQQFQSHFGESPRAVLRYGRRTRCSNTTPSAERCGNQPNARRNDQPIADGTGA